MAGRPKKRARLSAGTQYARAKKNRKTPPRGGGGRGRKSLLAHLKATRQYILDADRDGLFQSEPRQALGPVIIDLEEAIDYLERNPPKGRRNPTFELTGFDFKLLIEQMYHASLAASYRGHSRQSGLLFSLAEQLREQLDLPDSIEWRKKVIEAREKARGNPTEAECDARIRKALSRKKKKVKAPTWESPEDFPAMPNPSVKVGDKIRTSRGEEGTVKEIKGTWGHVVGDLNGWFPLSSLSQMRALDNPDWKALGEKTKKGAKKGWKATKHAGKVAAWQAKGAALKTELADLRRCAKNLGYEDYKSGSAYKAAEGRLSAWKEKRPVKQNPRSRKNARLVEQDPKWVKEADWREITSQDGWVETDQHYKGHRLRVEKFWRRGEGSGWDLYVDGEKRGEVVGDYKKWWDAAVEVEKLVDAQAAANPRRRRNPKSSKKEFVEQAWAKRAHRLPAHDYEPRKGLEGPFQYPSGKVLYWDPREGKYWDPSSDLYLTDEEIWTHIAPRKNPRQRKQYRRGRSGLKDRWTHRDENRLKELEYYLRRGEHPPSTPWDAEEERDKLLKKKEASRPQSAPISLRKRKNPKSKGKSRQPSARQQKARDDAQLAMQISHAQDLSLEEAWRMVKDTREFRRGTEGWNGRY